MLKLLLAVSIGALFVSPLEAGETKPVTKACQPGAKHCERWTAEFATALQQALKGNHAAQQIVAFCLSSGCRDAVVIDKVAACSWHLVIANSGAATVLDSSNLRHTCRPMTPAQKDEARANARELVRKIYNRDPAATDQM
ncbi:hypothetical protein [Rhizobium bangladeshense]|uniref:hypothetical protein n=1 Tax=Rhizobium bangladeshense TaxID=1138189 RepID=UPI001C833D97|nr:hypothetical protein [Rhizobium bangladeshense]MBX4893328.1 hypothetical protein [Rhizobium bangladeshense]MBX4913904.1 hypothetical protein [Rhizobium bangladeshense]